MSLKYFIKKPRIKAIYCTGTGTNQCASCPPSYGAVGLSMRYGRKIYLRRLHLKELCSRTLSYRFQKIYKEMGCLYDIRLRHEMAVGIGKGGNGKGLWT